MALAIQTFSNVTGAGDAFFKAIGHPLVADQMSSFLNHLKSFKRLAIYDPHGFWDSFTSLYDISGLSLECVYVQKFEALTEDRLPITQLSHSTADGLLVLAFDLGRLLNQIQVYLPVEMTVIALESLKLPSRYVTNPKNYLDPINFSTNFVFFREETGPFGPHHTRLTTLNYWTSYGATQVFMWLRLWDAEGRILAEWEEELPLAIGTFTVDSAEIREKFGLKEFCGQLFIHVIGAVGHDVVKYALDTYGEDPRVLSATHDANSFPSDYYAGLPAPQSNEQVILWVQNSHPCPIPPHSIGLREMGAEVWYYYPHAIPPFGVTSLSVQSVLPDCQWPSQVEIMAGKHFIRPRYEIVKSSGLSRIAHANVERTDLKNERQFAQLTHFWKKGFVLPAPLLPIHRFDTEILPTPMTTCYTEAPLLLSWYNVRGEQMGELPLGIVPRRHQQVCLLHELAKNTLGPDEWGHLELTYDFGEFSTVEVDGWLHALFRYTDRHTGHSAETSFGAHVFNTAVTYKKEPQSYAGPAPGLSTRLFLRLGFPPFDTFCQLIYPVSDRWVPFSQTTLVLYDQAGQLVSEKAVQIPAGGSYHWSYQTTFSGAERREAGPRGYVLIRDMSCRLFGYQGLLQGQESFSVDHMFGA